jgi:hypothetical protein
MVDRREIKRNLYNSYFISSKFTWSEEFKLTRELAAGIDDDLLAGIQFGKFVMAADCPECESRRRQEATAGIMDSLGALANKRVDSSDLDWKKDAFRRGSIDESWSYNFTPLKISKIVIFRKSDSRVIYELQPD